jgi:hypothetical protein
MSGRKSEGAGAENLLSEKGVTLFQIPRLLQFCEVWPRHIYLRGTPCYVPSHQK